jgi:hypothetical protein
LVVKLILLGSDIHCPGPALRGRTTLQSAAARRDEEGFRILQLLIEEHGVDVNEPRSEEEGYTSLEAACHETVQDDDASDIMAVEFLVGRGAVITPFTYISPLRGTIPNWSSFCSKTVRAVRISIAQLTSRLCTSA